jgi:spore maturation protein CgeB
LTCLREVVRNPDIHKVILLCENCSSPIMDEKIIEVPFVKRPTYDDFFDFMTSHAAEGDIMVLANTDIYPGQDDIKKLSDISTEECYLLSRWDIDETFGASLHARNDSQDVWVFRAPLKPINGKFNLGIPGCDNRIAHEIKTAGYELFNPSRTIRFYHLHNSGVRTYQVPGPYERVNPSHKRQGFKYGSVLHIGFDQPPLEKAFAKEAKEYRFIRWTDYEKNPAELRTQLLMACSDTEYDLIFLHIQTANIITPTIIRMLRATSKGNPVIVNWTGDVRTPLPNWYIELGKEVDVTLFSNETDANEARMKGIKADYLQIGYDTQYFHPAPSKLPWPEIVFLGNNYKNGFPLSDLREQTVRFLRSVYGSHFGLYGSGWGNLADGNLMGKPEQEADCYRGCKIAINLSHFDYKRYTSDRLFRIMGTGAFCLSKIYPDIKKDFQPTVNLATWSDLNDLKAKIDYYLQHEEQRLTIAQNGHALVKQMHTWEFRLEELLQIIRTL